MVSLTCRLTFDFSLWSERERRPPVLVVCEEAHRYVPAAQSVGFAAAARAITRIAREGRKYGVALALISQLPSELSPQALSQCEYGLRAAARALPRPTVHGNTPYRMPRADVGILPSMRTQEAIVFGEGFDYRCIFASTTCRPSVGRAATAPSSPKLGRPRSADAEFLEEAIRRWRQQTRKPATG